MVICEDQFWGRAALQRAREPTLTGACYLPPLGHHIESSNMPEPLLIAQSKDPLYLLPAMSNRHGLIAGATGTGKTVTLQVMAESFSRIGVPVFAADVKGDLSGISRPGTDNLKIAARVKQLKLTDFSFAGCPATFWDVLGDEGHPVRA